MPSHDIGPGKVMKSFAADNGLASLLGRQAFREDVSQSELIRRLIREYLHAIMTKKEPR